MKTPNWYETLKNSTELKDYNIEFFKPEKFEDSDDIYTFGIIKHHQEQELSNPSLKLGFDEKNPEQMLVIMGLDKPIKFFVDANIKGVKFLYEKYLAPTEGLKLDTSENPLVLSQYLRENYKPLTFPDGKQIYYYFGMANWDDMSALENSLVMNEFVALYTVCLATAQGVEGNYTQMYSQYSKSLISLIRYEAFGTTFYFYKFDYYPVENNPSSIEIDERYKNLPSDAPLDILGFLQLSNQQNFDLEQIFENAKLEYNSILILSIMLPMIYTGEKYHEKFEQYFSSLAQNENQQIRDFVAEEAAYRKNEKVLNLALEKGVSQTSIEYIENLKNN